MKINNKASISGCPRGGMVDTRDLKSLGLIGRASSSLAVGTRYVKINTKEKYCSWMASKLYLVQRFDT